MTGELKFNGETGGSTRREILIKGGSVGAAIGLGGLLAACGSSTTSSTGRPATGKINKGGTLTIGLPSGSAADSIDPNALYTIPDFCRAFNLYDGLAYAKADFSGPELRLAEEFSSDKTGREWTVRLKPGVEFHDGKTLTADDVIFSIRRLMSPKLVSPGGPLLEPFVDPTQIKKLDNRTVRFTLKRPYAEFETLMANWTVCYIVPEGFDPKKPVGTGPFKFKSIRPGTNSAFLAFDNYWDGRPYVDELVFTDLNEDSARLNALLGGQVDAIASVPFPSVASVEANGELETLNAETGAWFPIRMNCRAQPFSDERVRQAMRLIADRNQMLEQAYLGNGKIGNDLYSIYDPNYAQFPQREPDIEQAKSLLTAAGHLDTPFTFTATDTGPGSIEYSESFVQQATAAGLNMKLNKVDQSVYVGPNYLNWPIADSEWPATLGYLPQVGLADGPHAGYAETGFGDVEPRFAHLYEEAIGTLDAAKRKEIEYEMQKIQYDKGGYVVWGFQDVIDAASTRATGFKTDKSGWPLGSADFKRVYFV